MKNSFCKKILLLCFFVSSCSSISADQQTPDATIQKSDSITSNAHSSNNIESPQAQPDTATPAPDDADTISPEDIKALEQFFEQVALQLTGYLEHLENIVQQMALIVNTQQIRTIDPHVALQHLSGLKHDIALAKQQLAVQSVNPQTVLILISYAQVMTKYVHDVVKSGLKTFPDITNYASMMQKRSSAMSQKSPQDILKTLVKMEQAALKLEKAAESVGITKLNKLVRFTQRQWASWHMSRNIKWLLIGSVLMYAFLPYNTEYDAIIPDLTVKSDDIYINTWFTPSVNISEKVHNLKNLFSKVPFNPSDNDYIIQSKRIPLDQWMRNMKHFFGGRPLPHPHIRHVPIPAKNGGTLKIFSALESLMITTGIASLSLSNPIFDLGLFGALLKDDALNGYKWILDKTSRINSKLRGGPVMTTELRLLKEPRHTLDDIIGREDAKQIASQIVDYIINPARADRAGTPPEQGYLLAGPTRSGKTFFAEAIAGTIRQTLKAEGSDRFNFISLSSAEVLKYGISDVLKFARESAPCILFIDEIDMLGLQRERNAEMLSTFLTELSGAMSSNSESKIILIGATNLPENLDRALLQHGRIGTTLWFYYPTYEERFQFMKRKLSKWITSIDRDYLAQLARETHGHNFADLEAILEKAKLYADQKRKAIDTVELDRAFDRVIRNIIDEPLPVAAADKQLYALHNGAKAMLSVLLGTNEQLTKVTIKRVETKVTEKPLWARYDEQTASAIEKRKETFGKVFTNVNSVQRLEKNRLDYLAEIKMLLSGHMAEKMVLGSKSVDYNPYDEAIALAMCRFLIYKGTREEYLPKAKRQELDTKALALMKSCKEEIKKLLAQHKEQLMTITEQLVKHETLSARQVRAILGIAEPANTSDADQTDTDDEEFIDNDTDEQPEQAAATV